jgi:sphingomyelin phosphodiesterase acid-like 3
MIQPKVILSYSVRAVLLLLSACAVTGPLPGLAQSAAPREAPVVSGAGSGVSAAVSTYAHALFLSDVHFDPYTDPALVSKLDAAPASQWRAILATPPSATQKTDVAALSKACPVRADDTSQVLLESSLRAIRTQIAGPAHPAFIVISGDFLAHSSDCKYRFLFPAHTHDQYLAFSVNTLRYVFAEIRAAVPGVPIYTALGNNDTACGGNKLDPDNDFLTAAARIVADALPPGESEGERRQVLHDLAAGGYYAVHMAAPIENTRLLVIDDMFFLTEFSGCSGKRDYAEESAQIAWLTAQLAEARARKENVWVLGHIAPGVAFYSTMSKRIDVCAGKAPWMALESTRLAEVLAANADIIHLGIFAHTHWDEMALVQPGLGETPRPPGSPIGVPIKFIPSISPINLNNPTFTLATIDAKAAVLMDYTAFAAANLGGTGAWSKEYSYSSTYGEPDFSAASVAHLLAEFHADRSASTGISQAYARNFFAGAISFPLTPLWPTYVCAMDHQTGPGFAACTCAAGK